MPDNDLSTQGAYWINGKTYTQRECESVYLFWKSKLEEMDIREDILTVLERITDDQDMDVAQWITTHMDDCVDAVSRTRHQEEMFQTYLHDDVKDLDSTLSILRDLFAHRVIQITREGGP